MLPRAAIEDRRYSKQPSVLKRHDILIDLSLQYLWRLTAERRQYLRCNNAPSHGMLESISYMAGLPG